MLRGLRNQISGGRYNSLVSGGRYEAKFSGGRYRMFSLPGVAEQEIVEVIGVIFGGYCPASILGLDVDFAPVDTSAAKLIKGTGFCPLNTSNIDVAISPFVPDRTFWDVKLNTGYCPFNQTTIDSV